LVGALLMDRSGRRALLLVWTLQNWPGIHTGKIECDV